MIYTSQDIDRIFTAKVADLIAQGFHVNTSNMGDGVSMAAGEGQEIARIDLIKDDAMRRVTIIRSSDRKYSFDTRIIKVLSCPRFQFVYTPGMHVVSRIGFGSAGDKYSHDDVWLDIDSASSSAKKRHARRQARYMPCRHRMPDSANPIALRWLKKQAGCKSCRLSEIESVTRIDDKTTHSLYCYEIQARGKIFCLRPHFD